jgi:hypothetical protein
MLAAGVLCEGFVEKSLVVVMGAQVVLESGTSVRAATAGQVEEKAVEVV